METKLSIPWAIEAVTMFLPIFEAIGPDNFAQLVGSSEVHGEIPFIAGINKFVDGRVIFV